MKMPAPYIKQKGKINMKKTSSGLLAICLALILAFTLAACSGNGASSEGLPAEPAQPQTSGTVPAGPGSAPAAEAESAKEQTIAGNVTSNTADTMEIMTVDGHTFKFNVNGVKVVTPADGILEGDMATVYYKGTLDENLDIQDVAVSRIEVEHSEATITSE